MLGSAKTIRASPKAGKRDGWDSWATATTRPDHKVEDQAAMIHRCLEILERFCGKRPVGLARAGLTQTLETPDLSHAAGIKYIGDWVYDDADHDPTATPAGHAALLVAAQRYPMNRPASPSDYLLKRAIDQFDVSMSRARSAQDHGAGDPSLHQRPAAPDQISRGHL